MTYSSNLSKLRSMLEQSRVSSWCVPFSISCRAASSGESVTGGASCVSLLVALLRDERDGLEGGGGAGLKPIVWGGSSRSFCSTLLRARSASWLMLLIMSSMRLCPRCYVRCEFQLRDRQSTNHWRVAKVLCQENNIGVGCCHRWATIETDVVD